MTTPSSDDITVTTATQTEAEVRASLDAPAVTPPVEKPAVPPVEKPAEKPAVVAATPEAEADSDRPDPEVSEAARTLRKSRLSEKVARIDGDIQLYEDNIRRLGGQVPPFVPREYPNPQAKIDHLTRRRHELLEQTNRLLRTPPRREPEVPKPAADPNAAKPATGELVEPKFEFQTWEQYQVQHPEADYTEYTDARTDARYAWNEGVRQAKASHAADQQRATERDTQRATAFSEMEQHAATYKAAHPEFDTRLTDLGAHLLAQGGASMENGAITFGAKWSSVRDLLYRTPKEVAPVLDYLATHPDDVARLLRAPTPADLHDTVAEIRFTVRAAAPAAPASAAAPAVAAPAAVVPAAPPKPTTAAPAPLEPVSGTAQSTRTLQQLADDSENADDYIALRRRELRATG
jgi:hypothetical protein